MATKPDNHLEMSDEDFLNQPEPSAPVASQETFENENPPENPPEKQEDKVENKEESKDKIDKPVEAPKDELKKEDSSKDSKVEEPKVDNTEPEKPKSEAEKAAENILSGSEKKNAADKVAEPEAKKDEDKESEAKSEPDYKKLYEQVMAPFTANGKKIELKDPAEVIQLMQMGANYTRKLQELAPHRKMITMLGNHDLLDENKLSFLISLDKKDPEAIKKLIIDSGIDPLDIDTKVQPAYQEGSYQVTDQEVAFRTTLEDLTSTDEGKQTLTEINTWDQASKDMLWQNPDVMTVIKTQRDSGIYDRITTEIDRQKTLGQILPTIPFLEAYTKVGDQLDAAGKFNDLKGSVPPKVENKSEQSSEKTDAPVVVVKERAAEPKPIVDNGDKAGAASPTRTTPKQAKETVNFLSMSDDDFIKAGKLEGRV